MKNYVQIQQPTGHVWQIPTEYVVKHRATTMLALHATEFADLAAAVADTTELFADDDNIRDWLQNNMSSTDFHREAKLVRFTPPTRTDWINGEFSFHDHQALLGELDGETIISMPAELIMHTMAAAGQLCNMTVLQGEDGRPYGAFVMIIGSQPVISSYATALQFVGEQLTSQAAQQAAEPPAATH